jgi:hypothetical protein
MAPVRGQEAELTLDELDHTLPNGFHDGEILSLELNYAAATAKFHLSLAVGWSSDPEPERDAYQEATMLVTGLCFCSVAPPFRGYPLHPEGSAIAVSGDPAKPDHLPELVELEKQFPPGTWSYRFFVHDWNAFIYLAARDAEFAWIGPPPKHAQ